MRLLQCPLPTLHRPWPAPPFSGLRAALAGLKPGPVFFAPSSVVRGPMASLRPCRWPARYPASPGPSLPAPPSRAARLGEIKVDTWQT